MCSASDPFPEFPVLEAAICGAAAPPAASEAVFLAEESILGAEMSSLCLKEITGASDSSVPTVEIVELLDSNTGNASCSYLPALYTCILHIYRHGACKCKFSIMRG